MGDKISCKCTVVSPEKDDSARDLLSVQKVEANFEASALSRYEMECPLPTRLAAPYTQLSALNVSQTKDCLILR